MEPFPDKKERAYGQRQTDKRGPSKRERMGKKAVGVARHATGCQNGFNCKSARIIVTEKGLRGLKRRSMRESSSYVKTPWDERTISTSLRHGNCEKDHIFSIH